MKTYIAVLVCLLALARESAADACYSDVEQDCRSSKSILTLPHCNATYGGFHHHQNLVLEMQAYANIHLERSFEYLIVAAYYNNYQTNRGGFSKVFKKLSDDTWEKAIDLIQHITTRGSQMEFERRSSKFSQKAYTAEQYEVNSLAMALDTQKELASRAFHIHHLATRNNEQSHDPEVAQYLEEEFIEKHAKVIRELSGYVTDMKKFISSNEGKDLSLSTYVFDEYLKKVSI